MCFEIKTNRQLTAKKNIECYKAMNLIDENYARSACKNFIYKLKKTNPEIELKPGYDRFGCLVISKGYHSEKKLQDAQNGWNNRPVYLCIIPKGSKYYVNDYEYVSSNIIIVKLIHED